MSIRDVVSRHLQINEVASASRYMYRVALHDKYYSSVPYLSVHVVWENLNLAAPRHVRRALRGCQTSGQFLCHLDARGHAGSSIRHLLFVDESRSLQHTIHV
jgi:hypothetical protein